MFHQLWYLFLFGTDLISLSNDLVCHQKYNKELTVISTTAMVNSLIGSHGILIYLTSTKGGSRFRRRRCSIVWSNSQRESLYMKGWAGHSFWDIWRAVRTKLTFLGKGHYVIFLYVKLVFHPPSLLDNQCTVHWWCCMQIQYFSAFTGPKAKRNRKELYRFYFLKNGTGISIVSCWSIMGFWFHF